MNEYVALLKKYMAENPPNCGSDANSVLEMLYNYHHECNNIDTDAVKVAFMPLWEMGLIVDAACILCREHEKAGFVEGLWLESS